MFFADQHTHSDNSPDGECSVNEMCAAAASKKIDCIALTDHCEIDTFVADGYNLSYREAFLSVCKARDTFKNKIKVNVGIELAQATQNTAIAEEVIGLPYDIVIGSTHALPGMQDFYFLDYKNKDVKALFAQYLKEEKRLAEWGKFDTLAHLTYPLRYINGVFGADIKTADFGDEITSVFKEIIKRGISLEINASGLHQEIGETLPDRFCLEIYKSLGGERLTFGSDAHNTENVGKDIDKAVSLAKDIGFTYYCVYNKRKPQEIKL